MTTDTQRGAGLRVTSKQVDDILQWTSANTDIGAVILDICRDWLDMGDRLAAMQEMLRFVVDAYDENDRLPAAMMEARTFLRRDATSHPTEASSPASEEDGCE